MEGQPSTSAHHFYPFPLPPHSSWLAEGRRNNKEYGDWFLSPSFHLSSQNFSIELQPKMRHVPRSTTPGRGAWDSETNFISSKNPPFTCQIQQCPILNLPLNLWRIQTLFNCDLYNSPLQPGGNKINRNRIHSFLASESNKRSSEIEQIPHIINNIEKVKDHPKPVDS